ncbi:MAG: hypothetical protein HKN16_01470 [Saprospiraceae bacterium]|nr:hypothetical protein [Saprospiraceae bacterium]
MTDGKNSFKELENQNIEEAGQTPDNVEHDVMGIVQSGHLFGDVVELYFSKMIDLFLSLFGGSDKEEK